MLRGDCAMVALGGRLARAVSRFPRQLFVEATGDPVALDAALIGAAQRVEHYEIAGYGTARALAGELDLDKTCSLLDQTLDEEGKANKTLTKLAAGGLLSSGINRLAAERSENEVVANGDERQTDVVAADAPALASAAEVEK